jgi:hypothetical protein
MKFQISLRITAFALALFGAIAWNGSLQAQPSVSNQMADTCADGAITVSIAATVALFAEIALPAYRILFTVGPTVGCPARIIGERLKGYALPRNPPDGAN